MTRCPDTKRSRLATQHLLSFADGRPSPSPRASTLQHTLKNRNQVLQNGDEVPSAALFACLHCTVLWPSGGAAPSRKPCRPPFPPSCGVPRPNSRVPWANKQTEMDQVALSPFLRPVRLGGVTSSYATGVLSMAIVLPLVRYALGKLLYGVGRNLHHQLLLSFGMVKFSLERRHTIAFWMGHFELYGRCIGFGVNDTQRSLISR